MEEDGTSNNNIQFVSNIIVSKSKPDSPENAVGAHLPIIYIHVLMHDINGSGSSAMEYLYTIIYTANTIKPLQQKIPHL